MGVMDVMRKAGAAIVGSRSLEAQSRLLNGQTPLRAEVPTEVSESMARQGMATGGFTPGEPISPYQPVGTPPLITPFQVGQNIFAVPRGTTGVGFDALKNITKTWDLARLCIEVRLDELRGLDWEIVTDDEEDASRYADEIKSARRFFEHPADGQDFDDLQMKSAEDWLRYDALCIARRRSRNGKLGELEVIDGTTISPLIDSRGAAPKGPAPAYVQWAWGLPWVWLTNQDVIYKPHHPRPETRYGLPPAEWVMMLANTDLRLQWYFLTYFTEGEVPETFVNAPPDVQDPKQVKALQEAYSAVMSGARAAHHKVKWIPAGANVHMTGKGNFDMGLTGFMVAKGCAAYKVQPAEIGFTEKVNKSSGDTQADVTYRRAIKPTVKYFESIWNRILHEDLKMPYARFKYLNIEEEEDQLKLAQTRAIYIQNAVLSPDEVRKKLGEEVDETAPVGRAFAMRTGVIFVDEASQKYAREQGNLAQQYGMDGSSASDPEGDETTDGQMLTPQQALVSPVIKPVPAKPAQASAGGAPTTQTSDAQKQVQAELRKWRQVALKRAKEGRLQKSFETNVIDPLLHKMITHALVDAKTTEEVKAVFETLLGSDVPFSKRAIKRGRKVVRDTEARAQIQARLKGTLAELLKSESHKVAKHVRAAVENSKTEPGAVDIESMLSKYGWQGWDKQLKSSVSPELKAAYVLGSQEGIDALGGNLTYDMVDANAVSYAETRAAEIVGKQLVDGILVDNGQWSIAESTRTFLQTTVTNALKEGQSPYEIEQTILDAYCFSETRAETIARSETALAYNRGSVQGYRNAGVQHVEVEDGDDDPECAAADGSTWTLDHADANPTSHPNCTRSFSPISPDEDPDYIATEGS